MLNIPDGTKFLEEADQWHEISYTISNNMVCMESIDRKDPQHITGEPQSFDEFLTDPSVKERPKDWLREIIAQYSEK